MMKIIKTLFVTMLLLSVVPSTVFAEETPEAITAEPTLYDSDVEEGEMMTFQKEKDGIGARIKFEHISTQIDLRIQSTELIISKLEAKGTNVSTDELEAISAKFDSLLEDLNEVDLEAGRDELEEDLKVIVEAGKDITKEFKVLIEGQFTTEEIAEIKEEIKVIKDQLKEERKEEVQSIKDELLIANIKNLLDKLDIDSSEIEAKIESGEISMDEIREQVRALVKAAGKDKVREVTQRVKEEKQRDAVDKKARAEDRKVEFDLKKQEHKLKMDARKEEFKLKISENKEKFKADRETKVRAARLNFEEKRAENKAKYEEKRAENQAKYQEKRAENQAKYEEKRAENKAKFDEKRAENQEKRAEVEEEEEEDLE